MIIVTNKNKKKSYKFPKSYRSYDTSYTLIIHCKERGVVFKEEVTNESNIPFFYCFNISFGNLDDGEYEYCIKGKYDDKGVIRINSDVDVIHREDVTQYEKKKEVKKSPFDSKDNEKIIQYEN